MGRSSATHSGGTVTSAVTTERHDWGPGEEPLDGVVVDAEDAPSTTTVTPVADAAPEVNEDTAPVPDEAAAPASDADVAPEPDPGGDEEQVDPAVIEPDAPDRGRSIAAAVLAVAAVVLLGVTVWAGALFLGSRAEDEQVADVLDAARAAGATLTTISQDTAEQDIQRVVEASTGSFGDLFTSNTQAYVGVLKDGGVSTTGRVDEAGLQSIDGDTATVLAAVSSTVKNNAAPNGEQRYYRMMIELKHQDDGRWLVSNVEFIP